MTLGVEYRYALAACLLAVTACADWNQWRGPERNGVAPDSPPLADSWGSNGPPRLWVSEDLICNDSLGSVCVAGGRVYFAGVWPSNPPPPSADGRPPSWTAAIKESGSSEGAACLDANGKLLWRKGWPGKGSHSTPCVADGRCYVNGGKLLYCLDAATGQEVWQAPLGGDSASSPLVADGILVILDGPLTGLDARTGEKRWTASVSGGNCSPALWASGGTKYILCRTSAGLACVTLATGEVLWKTKAGGNSTPVVSGDIAVFLNNNKEDGLVAYRLTPEKAEKLWSVPFSDRGSTPVVYKDRVHIVCNGVAACYGLEKGDLKWEEKLPGEIASPLVADGKLIGTCESGATLIMVRAGSDTFELLGRHRISANWVPSPAISDGRLYVRRGHGVACYDLRRP